MELTKKQWEDIHLNRTNIILVKPTELDDWINDYEGVFFEDGRFKKLFFIKNQYIGSIIINGYHISKNFFKTIDIEKKEHESDHHYDYIMMKAEELIVGYLKSYDNLDWIYNNWNELKEKFKNEKEILVLNVEKWEI